MPTIHLGKTGQFQTQVSEEDYDFLVKWAWNFKRSASKYGRHIYARRTSDRKSGRVTILMHNVVLERMGLTKTHPDDTADHINRDPLDNRRENLRWACKKSQAKNRSTSNA